MLVIQPLRPALYNTPSKSNERVFDQGSVPSPTLGRIHTLFCSLNDTPAVPVD